MTSSREIARREQPPKLSAAQVQIVKNTIAKGATNDELKFFVEVCNRTGLNPLVKQIHYVKVWDSTVRGLVGIPIVGIDGLRLIAERTGEYDGQSEPEWYDAESDSWTDVWTAKRPPAAARVHVWKKGVSRPFVGIALWDEYVQTTRDGAVNSTWSKRGAGQLAKCAEALGLRKGFPNDLSGLYTSEELGRGLPTDEQQAQEMDKAGDRMMLRLACELAETGEFGDDVAKRWNVRAIIHSSRRAFQREAIETLDDLTDEETERILSGLPADLEAAAGEKLGAVLEGEVIEPTPPAPEPAALEPPTGEPGLAEQVAAAQEQGEPVPAPQEPAEEPAQATLTGEEIPWDGEPPHQGTGAYSGEPGQA